MTLDWIKSEISKEKDIDWLGIMNTAKALYKEENEKKSVLGLSKGFVNFIKSTYSSHEVLSEIKGIYNPDDLVIIEAGYHSKLNSILKEGKINSELLANKYVIVAADKTTIEPLFNKYNIPYIKFSSNRSSDHFKDENGKSYWKITFKWKKQGEKGIKWEKGKALSFKRENILEQIFEDDK